MLAFVRNYPLRVGAAGLAIVAGLAWVAFGYFGIHTAFIDDVVDEAGPVFDVPAVEAEPAAAPGADTSVDEGAADAPSAAAPAEAPAPEAPAAPAETPAAAPEVVTEFTGTFAGASRYSIEGTASVLGNGTEQRFLRFEDFESSNGPDLNVYLRNPDTGEFIDLGDLKGNIGSQNYEIPPDVDLDDFSVVEIWCVRFGVGFGQAELMST